MRIDKILLGALIAVSLSTSSYLALQKLTAEYEFALLPSLLFLAAFCSYFLFQGHKPLFKLEWSLWSAAIVVSLGLLILLVSQIETQVVLHTDAAFLVAGFTFLSLILAISSYLLFQTVPWTRIKFNTLNRKKPDKSISAYSLRSSVIPKIMTKLLSVRSFRRLAGWMAESIENNVIRSGLIESPSFLVQKYLTAAAICTPIALAVGICVATYVNPLGILLIFLPILVAFIPRLSTTTRAQDRDSTTEKELGLFMIHAAGMQSSGQNIFESFRDIIRTDIFVQLKN
ncbi:MAG: hypothetical protein M1368_02825, partial [Thaumarchaeota archaeon]|nr:hypothetical protein [Nitrososphaerota archaeon]